MTTLSGIQWKEAVAGAVSGAATVLCLHPLDVVKTRLQVQESGTHRYHGTLHAVQTITKREGLHGLYAGAWPILSLVHVYVTCCVCLLRYLTGLWPTQRGHSCGAAFGLHARGSDYRQPPTTGSRSGVAG